MKNSQDRNVWSTIICMVLGCMVLISASCGVHSAQENFTAYLFTYFTGNGPGEEAVRYAVSSDGYTFTALNNNKAILSSDSISITGGVRDPHILRGPDGLFYMVLTDLLSSNGWTNTAMIMLKSNDLLHWTSATVDIPVSYKEQYSQVMRVWAPQTIYDAKAKKYMVYFSMLEPGSYDKIYYAYANEEFTGLESPPRQLFYNPAQTATIDGDIIQHNGRYHLFYKTEGLDDKGIKVAVSDSLTGGYSPLPGNVDRTDKAVEGSGVFRLIDSDTYILMYDVYMDGEYQFAESRDLVNFRKIDEQISMNFHPRHGTVIPITEAEKERLIKAFPSDNIPGISAVTGSGIKCRNVVIDEASATVFIPVQAGTELSHFEPDFQLIEAQAITPAGAQDFRNGPVEYTLTSEHGKKSYAVTAAVNNNPVLSGYYADPEIIYSAKTGKYYLYPTSDGFTGWSGTYFKTFSSDDLVNWQDEGIILDLLKDVSWAGRNAWAPTIAEKEIEGTIRYFYYFTAAQKIGVAVSDHPAGPFTDSGRPLIDFRPKGAKWGQEIDPDVFTDPASGSSYLFWGNGYLAVAPLNADMVSIDRQNIRLLTPDDTFREGAEIFYREGKYYFLWSENDTRSPDYRVRYATSTSVTGPLQIPENNMVIRKNDAKQIYGTGHNCVLNIPGTDDWYIVYHRFTRPKGIDMGSAAGFNREVCMDRLTFNASGEIVEAVPSLEGIDLKTNVKTQKQNKI